MARASTTGLPARTGQPDTPASLVADAGATASGDSGRSSRTVTDFAGPVLEIDRAVAAAMARDREPPEPLADLRVPGSTPEHDRHRARLHASAVSGDPDAALEALGGMRRAGFGADGDDHLLVLVAHQLRGRAEAAEVYLRTLSSDEVTPAHLYAVLAAYAINRRSDDVERLYREFEGSSVPPDDDCRAMLLTALGFVKRDGAARRWVARWSLDAGPPVGPVLLARLVDAHAHPGARRELAVLHDALPEVQRRNPDVAAAFVFAFAGAGDAERAEAVLETALSVVEEAEVATAMVLTCIHARDRRDELAQKRLLALARQAGVDVERLNLSMGEDDA